MKKKVFLHEIKKNWMLCLMALPAVLCLFVFNYVPMAGLVMAFQRMDFRKGIFTSPFVGLDNFKFLFATTDAWIITRNTVCYNVVFLALALVCSVSLALLINELRNKLFAKTIQTIFIMPHFLSMVVISMIVYAFLGHDMGYVNNIFDGLRT